MQGMQTMHPGLSRGYDRFRHCGLSRLHGEAILHSFYRGVPRPAVLGSNARASEQNVMDEKDSGGAVPMSGLDRSGQAAAA